MATTESGYWSDSSDSGTSGDGSESGTDSSDEEEEFQWLFGTGGEQALIAVLSLALEQLC